MRLKDPRRLRSVDAVDGQLGGLANELVRLQGEYAARISLLDEIDKLLDRRLALTERGEGGVVRQGHTTAA